MMKPSSTGLAKNRATKPMRAIAEKDVDDPDEDRQHGAQGDEIGRSLGARRRRGHDGREIEATVALGPTKSSGQEPKMTYPIKARGTA